MPSQLPYVRNPQIEALTFNFKCAAEHLRQAFIHVDQQEALNADQLVAIAKHLASAKWSLARIDEALADPAAAGLTAKGGLQ